MRIIEVELRIVSAVSIISLGIRRLDLSEGLVDSAPELVDGDGSVLSNEPLDFGPGRFDGVEVWTVRWKVDDSGSGRLDQLLNSPVLVSVEIVHANDMARTEDGDEFLFNESTKLGRADAAPMSRVGNDPVQADSTNNRDMLLSRIDLLRATKGVTLW